MSTVACRLLIALSLVGCTTSEEAKGVVAPPPTYDGQDRALSFDGVRHYASTGTAAFPVSDGSMSILLWVRPLLITMERDGGNSDAAAVTAGRDGGKSDAAGGAKRDGGSFDAAGPLATDAGISAVDRQVVFAMRKDFESGTAVGIHGGYFEAWSTFDGVSFVKAPMAAMPRVWQHVAYTHDGVTSRLFVNGMQVAQNVIEPGNRTNTTAWLGSIDGASQLFTGELDSVHVYKSVLSSATLQERAAHREVDSARDDDPTAVLSLGFDEVSGHRALDHSMLGNDALLGDGIEANMPERVLAP